VLLRGLAVATFTLLLATPASAQQPETAPAEPPAPAPEPPAPAPEPPAPAPEPPVPVAQPAPAPQPPRPPAPQRGYGYPPPYGYPGYGYGYPPYGYGYGYGYPVEPPARLPYKEGEPAPAGYHLDTRIRKGLVIAGSTTFGACYLLSVGVAAAFQDDNDADDVTPMFVPLVGPFLTMGTADPTGFATFALTVDGLAQTVGLGMFIAGIANEERVWVHDTVSLRVGPGSLGVEGQF
jgi:hypothetical protein